MYSWQQITSGDAASMEATQSVRAGLSGVVVSVLNPRVDYVRGVAGEWTKPRVKVGSEATVSFGSLKRYSQPGFVELDPGVVRIAIFLRGKVFDEREFVHEPRTVRVIEIRPRQFVGVIGFRRWTDWSITIFPPVLSGSVR